MLDFQRIGPGYILQDKHDHIHKFPEVTPRGSTVTAAVEDALVASRESAITQGRQFPDEFSFKVSVHGYDRKRHETLLNEFSRRHPRNVAMRSTPGEDRFEARNGGREDLVQQPAVVKRMAKKASNDIKQKASKKSKPKKDIKRKKEAPKNNKRKRGESHTYAQEGEE
ncbi:hypothetical protein L596_024582 [Steinernema carpocapsae]|uniref:Uncharacterized protein n=1 Tax=Steinernema carpocapsae TaxID=34508 RepID=A0A4U5MHJ2_STECR|nr:hypothetical protein L596_024582 [Steinernema carpocapsae]